MLTLPLEPEDEELLLELLEELELLDELLEDDDDEEEDDDEEDEELLTPDEDDEELLELEVVPEEESVPPQATRVSAKRHELAIVTGRRQSTNVFIEDIFTYLFLVTHIVS